MKDKFLSAFWLALRQGNKIKRGKKKAPEVGALIGVLIFRTLTLKGIENLLLKLRL